MAISLWAVQIEAIVAFFEWEICAGVEVDLGGYLCGGWL